jgi:hypothetical protein
MSLIHFREHEKITPALLYDKAGVVVTNATV